MFVAGTVYRYNYNKVLVLTFEPSVNVKEADLQRSLEAASATETENEVKNKRGETTKPSDLFLVLNKQGHQLKQILYKVIREIF